jgi:uncharacterized protein
MELAKAMRKTTKLRKVGATAEELFRDAELKEERGDFRGAFRSYLVSASLGDVGSQVNVGNYYSAGRGVRKNLPEAAKWYRLAYRNGVSDGALNLSVDFERQGNTRNAISWLKRAIAMKNGDAYLRLAKIYLKRQNGTKTAIDLLKNAMMLGPSNISDEAREQVRSLLKSAGSHT